MSDDTRSRDPIAERPDMDAYGVSDDPEGLLPWSWASTRLVANRNYWVVSVSAAGRPHSMPVWGVWRPDENDFWFSCSPEARKARNLAANPRITITNADTVEVVSVEGRAELVPDGEERAAVLESYGQKYGDENVTAADLVEFLAPTAVHRVVPERAFGIIEEPDLFQSAATRWRWA